MRNIYQFYPEFGIMPASERMEYLIKSMKQQYGITEQLKARDQMKWVGLMNNIKSAVEEITLKELVYV